MLIWIPGYRLIKSNEKADESAISAFPLHETMVYLFIYIYVVLNSWDCCGKTIFGTFGNYNQIVYNRQI